ncbi:MAG: bifunctional diaminohydroxyphosphoribosylaminopyrimidine deaminase/5-amino-6-(5-phosphoribosylamino)uracil reductase RibD [Pseudomonadota bacterium]
MTQTTATHDLDFLTHAIRLGARGLGRTAPNPSVGALLVATEKNARPGIVGYGVTAPGGRPHAEPQALAMAGGAARGATLYVSLEPCSHHGRTAPCADAIVEAGVARVVCALQDPDSRVAGRGLSRLKEAGIAVDLVPRPDAALLNAPHTLRVQYARPHVVLKLAVSADGQIAAGDGAPVWVTGPEARARGHLLRARADAILVGSGTVIADDPRLDCRLPGLEDRAPRPVILASKGIALENKKLASRDPIICVADDFAPVPNGGLSVPRGTDGQLDPRTILGGLAVRGMTSVLIEGGPRVAASFLSAGVVDEVMLFRGANIIEGPGLDPLPGLELAAITESAAWQHVDSLTAGDDTLHHYCRSDLLQDLMPVTEGASACSPD